jgi:4-hydroxy-tetrahydrodipicolinate reductase
MSLPDAALGVALHGADGRMGRALATLLDSEPGLREVAIDDADVLVDFTSPDGLVAAVELARRRGCALLSGSTGLAAAEHAVLDRLAGDVAVLWSPNFCLGVHVLRRLVQQAAQWLGPGADVEIVDRHHRGKLDAPSGTAIALGEVVAGVRGVALDQHLLMRQRSTAAQRVEGDIGFSSLRCGSLVGEHEVLFAMQDETLRLEHRALDRGVFARGALHAARWLAAQPPGRYDLDAVLDRAASS